MVVAALSTWFLTKEHGFFAWFGLAVIITYSYVLVQVNNLQVDWQGRFYTLIQNSKESGPEGIDQVYTELFFLIKLSSFSAFVKPVFAMFKNWYSLSCDQAIQRMYVARWPNKVPEGAGQRVHEDVGMAVKTAEQVMFKGEGGVAAGGLREAWMWLLMNSIMKIGALMVFLPKLMALSVKFPPPALAELLLPAGLVQYWVVVLAVVVPIIATLVSILITRRMKSLNYELQAYDAEFRKVLVLAEDVVGKPVVEALLQSIMRVAVQLWTIYAMYSSWVNIYDWVPWLILQYVTIPQLFSSDENAPTYGDQAMLTSSFSSVTTSLSFIAQNMDVFTYFHATLQRLYEFEQQAYSDGDAVRAPDERGAAKQASPALL